MKIVITALTLLTGLLGTLALDLDLSIPQPLDLSVPPLEYVRLALLVPGALISHFIVPGII